MPAREVFAGLLLAGVLVCGCKKQSSSPPAPAPSTQAASAGRQPATTGPAALAGSVLRINDSEVPFPRARIQVLGQDPNVSLMLFSDDPPQPADAQERGNSFCLQIDLDIGDLQDLPSATWHYEPISSQEEDAPGSITLEGGRKELKPVNVQASFDMKGDRVTVTLSGQFLLLDSGSGQAAQPVTVRGKLTARLESD